MIVKNDYAQLRKSIPKMLFLLCGLLAGQQEAGLGLQYRYFSHEGENSFWTRSNTHGQVEAGTYGLGVVQGAYATRAGEDLRLMVGAAGLISLEEQNSTTARFNQYFAGLQYKQLELSLGARQRPGDFMGLSAINGDILWSNNAAAPPGILLSTASPLRLVKGLSLEGALGHYWLGDDRYVPGAMLHYKEVKLHLSTGASGSLQLGLKHYALWGGDSPDYGSQPSALADFAHVVIGREGRAGSNDIEALNALGNHLGSYLVGYIHEFKNFSLQAYHQSLFEDSSGQEGKTFPDGAWGLFLASKKNRILKGLMYEYLQTTWQSGRYRKLGNDNYFNNGIYRSGWTYRGQTIGMPFALQDSLRPGISNNNFRVHHLGLRAGKGPWDLGVKLSYAENRGTFSNPYPVVEKVVYSWADLSYHSSRLGSLGLSIGADWSSIQKNRVSIGLSYRHTFVSGCRDRDCSQLENIIH